MTNSVDKRLDDVTADILRIWLRFHLTTGVSWDKEDKRFAAAFNYFIDAVANDLDDVMLMSLWNTAVARADKELACE